MDAFPGGFAARIAESKDQLGMEKTLGTGEFYGFRMGRAGAARAHRATAGKWLAEPIKTLAIILVTAVAGDVRAWQEFESVSIELLEKASGYICCHAMDRMFICQTCQSPDIVKEPRLALDHAILARDLLSDPFWSFIHGIPSFSNRR